MTVNWSWSIEAVIGDGIADMTGAVITDMTGAEIHDLGYADIGADVLRDEAIEWGQGINGANMTDLVAQSGTLSFALDNSEGNSQGLLGAYSPGHTNLRSPEWKRGAAVRIGITYAGVTDYFLYYITNIEPPAGRFRERVVNVTCNDWLYRAARAGISKLPVQVNQRPDQVLATLLAATNAPPLNSTLNTEPFTTFAYALHDELDEKTKLMTVLQKVAQSSGGSLFIDSDTTDGETLVYEHRLQRPARSVIAAFDDTMSELDASWPDEALVDQVRATFNPGRVDLTDVVLGEMAREERIAPGETRTVELRLRDPNGLANRVSAISLVSLVAGTDYRFSSIEGDGGADLNSSLVIVENTGANMSAYDVRNAGAVPGYLNTLQVRGKGIYLYDPLDFTTGAFAPDRPVTYNGPYLTDYFSAKNMAEMLYSRMGDDTRPTVGVVGFYADTNATFMSYYRSGRIGQPFTLSEFATGLSAKKFYVNQRSFKIEKGTLYVQWLGEPADIYNYFQLDSSPLDNPAYVLA